MNLLARSTALGNLENVLKKCALSLFLSLSLALSRKLRPYMNVPNIIATTRTTPFFILHKGPKIRNVHYLSCLEQAFLPSSVFNTGGMML